MSIDDGAVAPVLMDDRAPGMSVVSMTRRRPRSRRRRCALLVLGVAGGVLLGACGDGDADPVAVSGTTIGRPPSPSALLVTPVPATAGTIDGPDAARAERGFRGYVDAWIHANGADRPGVERLGEALVGRAFDTQMDRTQNLLQIGLYVDLPDPSLVRADLLWVEEENGGLTAEFCFLDGTRLMLSGTDRVMNDEVLIRRVRVTYEATDASSPRVQDLDFSPRFEDWVSCG